MSVYMCTCVHGSFESSFFSLLIFVCLPCRSHEPCNRIAEMVERVLADTAAGCDVVHLKLDASNRIARKLNVSYVAICGLLNQAMRQFCKWQLVVKCSLSLSLSFSVVCSRSQIIIHALLHHFPG